MTSRKLHLWESALMVCLAAALLTGSCAGADQAALARQVLRLHIVADSDDPADQAVKLKVRDAVLEQAEALLNGAADSREAERALTPQLDALARTAREVLEREGFGDGVTVTITDQWFPTKRYDGFALPAGQYRALKVVIGEGRGQNWWCVVFPPLCLASVTEEVAAAAAEAGLSGEQVALITGQDGGYVLKFKLIEWWEELLAALGVRK